MIRLREYTDTDVDRLVELANNKNVRAREAAHETNPDLFPEDPAKRATFHEIRALGAKLYKELGINPKELLGHLDEKTTRVYLDRHQIKWVAVKAVLKLS